MMFGPNSQGRELIRGPSSRWAERERFRVAQKKPELVGSFQALFRPNFRKIAAALLFIGNRLWCFGLRHHDSTGS